MKPSSPRKPGPRVRPDVSSAVPKNALAFVGCFCGSTNSINHAIDGKGQASECSECQRLQCLLCGEDFNTMTKFKRHLQRFGHPNSVTTEFSNRPPTFSTAAPKLNKDIKLFHCSVDCPGTPYNAYKINQYISKCTICQVMRCLICGYGALIWEYLARHFQRYDHKPFNFKNPVTALAITRNNKVFNLKCAKCEFSKAVVLHRDCYKCKKCSTFLSRIFTN
ncbi:hypothetical protein EB796_012818 [Bugula neritina]|uniref:C2H2-type domain-containing protein n=1 Tax=Bugula neritina TaxID=10212 RepID=A0A7J7JTY3_BUGNE|nr:hypothetical protein EB796_012818 [Bugula neritina]